MKISSSAFTSGQLIPTIYTCDGHSINPPLTVESIPLGTMSLTITFDDPDATLGTFHHWLVWNIPANMQNIPENWNPTNAVQGESSSGQKKYVGPCPPKGQHRYIFTVYALNTTLNLPSSAKRSDIDKAMEGHVLDSGQLMGLYSR